MQAASAATVFSAGETLKVSFQLAPPVCEGGPCDTLLIFPSADQAFSPVVGAVALFDGETILAAVTGTYAPVFASSDSLVGTGLAATADFTTILDGTIDGSITFELLGGAMTWNGPPGLNIALGRAIAPGFVVAGTSVAITGVSILGGAPDLPPEAIMSNPEPGSLWLACGGGLALWCVRKRRR